MAMMAPEAMPPEMGMGEQLPPELMAALAGGAPPPGAEGAPPEQAAPSDPAAALDDLIELFKAHPYMSMESDPEDISVLQNIVAQLTKLKAKQQKEVDAAMGVSPAQKGMRRGYAQA